MCSGQGTVQMRTFWRAGHATVFRCDKRQSDNFFKASVTVDGNIQNKKLPLVLKMQFGHKMRRVLTTKKNFGYFLPP